MKKMKPVLKKISKEKGYTRVEKISPDVLWVSDDVNETESVIKAYNKKYK